MYLSFEMELPFGAALFSSITIKIFRALLLNVYTLTYSMHESIIHKHINVLIERT